VGAREELHRLVDLLPDAQEERARRLLRALIEKTGDPFLIALATAPDDDEPSTPAEDASADEAWRAYQRGEGRPWQDVRRELGRG